MKDQAKTKNQLINELTELRRQIANVNNIEEEYRQLKKSNEKFTKAFMQSAVPMYITTLEEGKFIDVSNAFLKFTGFRRDEIIGRTSLEIGYITKEQRTVLFNELNQKGCVENLELKVGTKHGGVGYGLFNAIMMTIDNEKYLLTVMVDVTKSKQTEEALPEDGKEFCTFQVTEKPFQPFVCSEDVPGCKMFLKSGMDTGQRQDEVEYRLQRTDCPRQWHTSGGIPLIDEKRVVVGYEVNACEERFRALVETTDDWIWETDAQGVYTYASPKVRDILGYEQSEILGKTPLELMPFDEAKRVAKITVKYFEEAKPFVRFENLNLHKDGRVLVLETNGVPIVDKNGCLTGYRGIDRDITERKRVEESLRESEERYRHIFENAIEGIFLTTPEGGCLSANPVLSRILGYESPAELTRAISDIGGQIFSEPSRWLEFKRLLSEHGMVRDFETQLICKDKNKIWVVINANAIKDGEGNILSYQGTIMDITEKKNLETQLLQAQKMEAIGTLAGGVAHDFNNLLLVIQEYVSLMLLDIGSSHRYYRYLKTIEAQVLSGADLTGQLLGFASGKKFVVKPTNMNDIIQKTSSMFWRTKKEISIFYGYGKDLWTVAVDRGKMEQLFVNLYVNAWQAMPGGGEINIKTENIYLDNKQAFPLAIKEGKYVRISVADTGTGMDESTKKRIFDPFFTTKEKGTGLGLATVYAIVKGHEGMINVYSEPSRGTTFNIYLPVSDREVVAQETVDGTDLKGVETILLVDDEKMVLDVTKELLESLGYRIYVAQGGREAITVYMEKKKQIDLVILDVIMPGISGGETFDRLREINPEIRVLLSSGYSINGEAQKILNRGCNGFLPKPFRMRELAQNVRKMLD